MLFHEVKGGRFHLLSRTFSSDQTLVMLLDVELTRIKGMENLGKTREICSDNETCI